MNKDQLLHIIENPSLPIESDLILQLEELLKEYPYFQVGHILLARAYFLNNNVFADKKIKKAAVYTSNRKKLKRFINQPIPESNTSTNTIIDEPIEETAAVEKPIEVVAETSPIIEEITTVEKTPENTTHSEIEKTLAELKANKEKITLSTVEPEQPKISIKKKAKTVSKKAAIPSITKEETPIKEAKPRKKKEEKPVVEKAIEPKIAKKKDLGPSRFGDAIFEQTNDLTHQDKESNSADLLLKYLEHTRAKKRVKKHTKADQVNIIDSFIQKDPSISRGKTKNAVLSSGIDLSLSSTVENNNIVTENFALLHARQGNIPRAISIYEELILKYPQKKSYFASQIEKLKN